MTTDEIQYYVSRKYGKNGRCTIRKNGQVSPCAHGPQIYFNESLMSLMYEFPDGYRIALAIPYIAWPSYTVDVLSGTAPRVRRLNIQPSEIDAAVRRLKKTASARKHWYATRISACCYCGTTLSSKRKRVYEIEKKITFTKSSTACPKCLMNLSFVGE